MNRKVTFILLISLVFTSQAIFAQQEIPEMDLTLPLFYSVPYFAVTIPGEETYIPEGILSNEFYLESLRLTKLAHDTYEIGDYDASAGFAQEAIRFAQLSDEFVAVQLIAEAKRLLDWADKNNIANRHPNDYRDGKYYYETSLEFHSEEDWNETISSATKSISIFAALETGRTITTTTASRSTGLPKQYTVRTWAREKDCLWNISGYSWVYGDPSRWKVLYEANKSKMPDSNNPNLIEPGMVLDIPSIKGETREGMWRP
jgi:HEPN domain-containing protein